MLTPFQHLLHSKQAGERALAAWEAERAGLRAACEGAVAELMRGRTSYAEAATAAATELKVSMGVCLHWICLLCGMCRCHRLKVGKH